jgi:hypothetical protein
MNVVNASIQMPPLARNIIDTNAVQIMADWINSLSGVPALPPPTLSPAGGIFQGFVSVSLQDADATAALYYTLDGSLPTTSSLLYSGPFTLTTNAVVNANAWAAGHVNSVVGAASFTITPGAYFTDQEGFTNGSFQMVFAGPAGSNYVLQVSSNLLQWSSIVTNTPATTPFLFTDPGAPGQSVRFYRVLQQ